MTSDAPDEARAPVEADESAAADVSANAEVSADAGEKPSGLRNPAAAVRGVGAGSLVIEAIVLLLAIVPLHVLGVRDAGAAIATVIALSMVCILLAGMLSRSWAWWAGFVPQVALLACGYFSISLAILGVLFLLLWTYVLSVRRSVLGRS
jgi:hypothetical protein